MRILYNTFAGRYADSPRALYEVLKARDGGAHEHVWIADPRYASTFPEGVSTVTVGSPESIAALEASDLVIANTHTEVEWEKRPETVYLQTWHGTPLKRIHWDVLWAPEGRLERLQRDVDRWDYLVSPNQVSTDRLRGAFRFEGPVLETGYPRNDVLSRPDAGEIRARVRRELGIPDGKTVVLYTPTWRDDEVFGGGEDPIGLHLDVAAFADRFGDDHHLLLRLHYMLTGRLAAMDHRSVQDVSLHPDIAELYLAADVMVTDYSSTMFDFAVTGKPMLFYTYDLSRYRDELRGFYFDFLPLAPGPLIETSPELLDAIGDLPAVTAAHAEAYARFQTTFCHLEDGGATERILDAVLADRRLG